MTDNTKKFLVVFGGGFLLFWLLKDSRLMGATGKKKDAAVGPADKIKSPEIDPKQIKNKQQANAFVALKAYVDAVNAGENQKALDDLNREFTKDLKVRVYKRSSDSKLVVSNLEGAVLMINNG
jgi:hypothetical protein